MGEKRVCPCGNSIDYKPDDDYHLLGEEQTKGRCKDCLEHELGIDSWRKLKSNDRAFRTGWSVVKAPKIPTRSERPPPPPPPRSRSERPPPPPPPKKRGRSGKPLPPPPKHGSGKPLPPPPKHGSGKPLPPPPPPEDEAEDKTASFDRAFDTGWAVVKAKRTKCPDCDEDASCLECGACSECCGDDCWGGIL